MREYLGHKCLGLGGFEFDAINQLLKAIDNGGNETLSSYDMAGRRTQVIHPVSGIANFIFDNAGNLLSRQTANLEAENKAIEYDYDYNRLVSINYPDHPENNVKMTYGNKNAAFNRVGRLMLQEDATGAQEFFYDRLGNVEKVRRTVIIPNQAIATYVTEWRYDSWNRLTEMIYPDLEKISYSYNLGGQLESVKGQKSYSYNYVNKIGYDKFEQRTYMKYCNGAETNYTYDNERRRLSNLSVVSGKDTRRQIMNNAYTFDAVDNVLSVTNMAPTPTTGMGGQMTHGYNYDGLYRLVSATGSYTGAAGKTASYSLDMQYDNLHNITSKKQHVQQSNIVFDGTLKAGYDLTYNYDKPFQISTLQDENYRTEGDAEKDKITNEHTYKYDANGNLIYVNISREKQDGTKEAGSGEKKYLWDEENRLLAANTNGFISSYWYDASGERVIKASGDDEGIYVNGLFSGARTETSNFTAYINPYLVVSKGGNYTKHIYIGNQRIVSKLGDLDSYGQDPRRIAYAGADVDGASVDYKGKYLQSQQTIKERYGNFEVPYYGKDNDDYVNGGGFCCDDNPKLRGGAIGSGNDNPEIYQYYYHSDHLGSTSLITDLDGDIVQHVEYVPFGEVFIEERNNKWNTPYLFNAKEVDEETGLYYYGMRYLDSRTSIWLSVDPLAEKYPNVSTYAYCHNNPVNAIDPTGMDDYKLNSGTGEIEFVNATESNTHTIYAADNKGKINRKNSFEVEKYVLDKKETVKGVLGRDSNDNIHESDIDIYTSLGDEKTTDLFEFLAKNSDVEWSHIKTTKGDQEVNYLATSHSEGNDVGQDYMIARIFSQNDRTSEFNLMVGLPLCSNIREANHNHPNGAQRVSVGDVNVAKHLQSRGRFPNATMKIFTPFDGIYTPFNQYSDPHSLPEIEIIFSRPNKP